MQRMWHFDVTSLAPQDEEQSEVTNQSPARRIAYQANRLSVKRLI
jgi:hypothetical protein